MLKRMLALALAVVAGVSLGLVTRDAVADVKAYSFTNNTPNNANDLHIEFIQGGVTWQPDPPPPFTVSTGSGSSTFNASGGTVNSGSTMPTVTFTTTGSGPTINQGWWTINGAGVGNLSGSNTHPYP